MLPEDKKNRDLLPFIQADWEGGIRLESDPGGAPVVQGALPQPAASATMTADAEISRLGESQDGEHLPVSLKAPSPFTFHVSPLGAGDAGTVQIAAPSPGLGTGSSLPLANGANAGADGHSDPAGARQESDRSESRVAGRDSGREDEAAANTPDEHDVHSISVGQDAEVRQDASIIVNGYAGKVIARLHVDQDLVMDQSVDIDVAIDGDEHFSIMLDQDMRIEQEIDIDLAIYDDEDILYIDLFLNDKIDIEQDTSLDMQITSGSRGGDVTIDQDIGMSQDVDINVDIEDDLEERYAVKVDIDIQQDVDADQDAAVRVTDQDGEIGTEVEAFQTAFVDQETTVQIDFAAV